MDKGELGRLGEEEAVRYLGTRGWSILGRNVRMGRNELDIIALRGWVLAFVEVKCRSGRGFGDPFEAITPAKQKEVIRGARAWLHRNALPSGTLVRFDAISVIVKRKGPIEVRHVPDAWRLS